MDTNRFDALARQFGTRRSLLGVLALATAALVNRSSDEASAKKKKHKKKKCKNGTIHCGKPCVNPQTDAAHCGGCGNACASGAACVNGACVSGSCPSPQVRCGDRCVDTNSDEQHCGGCNRVCSGELSCLNGVCGCADNAESACGNFCVNTKTDRDNCGDCGHQCGNGESCQNGGCASAVCCGSNIPLGGSCGNDKICTECTAPLLAGCNCPNGTHQCRFDSNQCTTDENTDDHRCGGECRNCGQDDPGSNCCNGACNRGCGPNESCGGSNSSILCPANGCQPCGEGKQCCNRGPGTAPECVTYPGSFCPPANWEGW